MTTLVQYLRGNTSILFSPWRGLELNWAARHTQVGTCNNMQLVKFLLWLVVESINQLWQHLIGQQCVPKYTVCFTHTSWSRNHISYLILTFVLRYLTLIYLCITCTGTMTEIKILFCLLEDSSQRLLFLSGKACC